MTEEEDNWGLIAKGSHILGIVRPGTEDHHNLAFGFLRAGLNKGEMAVYVTNEDQSLVKRTLEKRWGGTFLREAEEKLRILSSRSVCPPGLKPADAISAFTEMYMRATSSGFTGLRIADITFLGVEEGHLQSIVDCDRAYDALELGSTALCMYQGPETYDFDLFVKLLLCHSAIIDHRLHQLRLRESFLRDAIYLALGEIFGENGAKAVLLDLTRLADARSTEDFLFRVQEEPMLLYRTMNVMFGQPSNGICELIKDKLTEMVKRFRS